MSDSYPHSNKEVSNSCPNLRNINSIILHSEAHPQAIPQQADSDEKVVELWLHGRSRHTQIAYAKDVENLFCFLQMKPLRTITLGDIQSFADHLQNQGLQPSSQHRVLAAVKSLFTFAHKIGYLQFNPGKAMNLPKFRDCLNERILTETELHRLIGMENHRRNRLMLRLLYATGVRVSELCSLTWKDFQARETGGQMTYVGKRMKTNTIIIPEPLWTDLMGFRKEESLATSKIFISRKGEGMSPVQVWRIVKKAAQRAGIKVAVSPHWFRHAHASHALDHGAKITLVKETLNHASIQTTGRYLHAKPGESSSTYLKV